MISYLGTVQEFVDSSVYGRGVKLYLEGKVNAPVELDMEFWREYEVYDRMTFTVKVPVFHLALKRHVLDDHQKVGSAMTEYTHCDCEYYKEMGLCKHIVGVCASLEQEFGIKQETSSPDTSDDQDLSEKDESQILDRIFEVDIDKKSRAWEHDFEAYLSQSGDKIPQSLKNMIVTVSKEYLLYGGLLNFINKYSLDATTDFNKEKNLIRFALFSLHYSNPLWVEMWLALAANFTQKHRRKLITELWIIIKSGAKKDIVELLKMYLKNLEESEKIWYIEELQSIYKNNKDIWLELVFVSEAKEWIKLHYQELDPLTLLKFAPLIPDNQEEIEITILNQLKQWADFLQVGDYDEVVEVFHRWQRILGRSSYFEEALTYFKSIHSKKRSLIKSLTN